LAQMETRLPEAPPQRRRAPVGTQHKPRPRDPKPQGKRHPFRGRKGSAFARRFKNWWFEQGNAHCEMCGRLVNGKGSQCHVDHIRPHELRPDLSHDYDNLQVVCTRCHNGTCQSIEKRHWPDAERIAAEKRGDGGFGADGWPVWTE